jgi:hypothetical protein
VSPGCYQSETNPTGLHALVMLLARDATHRPALIARDECENARKVTMSGMHQHSAASATNRTERAARR